MSSFWDIIFIVFWVLLYGVSIVIATAAVFLRKEIAQTRLKKGRWIMLALPYAIAILPLLFSDYLHNQLSLWNAIVDIVILSCTTWVLVFCTKEQWKRL